jgi:hypothetical protein
MEKLSTSKHEEPMNERNGFVRWKIPFSDMPTE